MMTNAALNCEFSHMKTDTVTTFCEVLVFLSVLNVVE